MSKHFVRSLTVVAVFSVAQSAHSYFVSHFNMPVGSAIIIPSGINNDGVVIGYGQLTVGGPTGMVGWLNSADPFVVDPTRSASGISSGNRVVVGRATGIGGYFGELGSEAYTPVPSVFTITAISSDGGYMAGQKYDDTTFTSTPVLMSQGGAQLPVPLPSGSVSTGSYRVNSSGTIVGIARADDGVQTGFAFVNGQTQSLNASGLGFVIPRDVNDAGIVIGETNDITTPAVLAMNVTTGQYQQLPGLPDGRSYGARAINNLGDIIGFQVAENGNDNTDPILWQHGHYDSPINLRELLGLSAQDYLLNAFDINDHGDILLWQRRMTGPNAESYPHPVILSGVLPEPSAALICVFAGGALRRRR